MPKIVFLLQSNNLHKVERSSHEDSPDANDNNLCHANDTWTTLFDSQLPTKPFVAYLINTACQLIKG